MSKQHDFPSAVTGNGNVVPFIPARKVAHRIITLAIVVAVALLAAASWMQADPASNQTSTAAPATASANAEFAYFPWQYSNQASEPTEHIQAF